MSLTSRLLSSSQQLLLRKALPLNKIGGGVRNKHVIAVPARNKMAPGELIGLGVLLGITMWSYPFWVIYHLPDYQQENRNQYTGK